MRELIKNVNTLEQLIQNGVGKIDFCNRETIEILRNNFDELHPNRTSEQNGSYYVSMYGPGNKYFRQVHSSFLKILSPILDTIFTDYKVPIVVAQIKGIGKNSSVGIHQDLTIVDELKYRSYVLWIPLDNSDQENGTLAFLESSHKWFRNARMHTANYMFENVEELIFQNSKLYNASLGQALLFDPATIHFSSDNLSDRPRRSIAMEIVDIDAPLTLYHHGSTETDVVDVYSVPDDFWLHYDDFAIERNLPPKFGMKIGRKTDVRTRPYTRSDFFNFQASRR